MKLGRTLVLIGSLFIASGAQALTYKVQGENVFVNGEVFRNDLKKFKRMIKKNPDVKTLVLMDIPGSADDTTNLRIIALIRQLGLNTHLTKRSHVTSGGTDLFLGGVRRTMERGARVGVHSWADGGGEAGDYPDDDPVHDQYIDLYEDLGISEDFYWFTLDAAGADDMHYMTNAEIKRYGLVTAPIR